MKLLRPIATMAAVFLLAFSISLYTVRAARGSDHQDSPTVVANPLADITDVFAFPNPHNASRVALVMDIRPLIPAGMFSGIALDPNVLYQFKIANSGVASNSFTENTVLQFTADSAGSGQNITLYGPAKPNEVGVSQYYGRQDGHIPVWEGLDPEQGYSGVRGAAARSVLLRSRTVLQNHPRSQLQEPPKSSATHRDLVPIPVEERKDHSQRRKLRDRRIEQMRNRTSRWIICRRLTSSRS